MKTLRGVVIGIVLASVVLMSSQAWAQPPLDDWTFVRDASGTTWLVSSGIRVGVPIAAATEEQIQAIRAPGAWLMPGSGGSNMAMERPSWDISIPVVAAPASIAAPAPAPAPSGWQTTSQWNGNSPKTTEPFSVSTTPWRLSYTVRDPKFSNPQVCIRAISVATNRGVSGGCYHQDETSFVYAPAGQYYLDISSSDVWSVKVEEQR